MFYVAILIALYALFNLILNLRFWYQCHSLQRPFEEGWATNSKINLFTDQAIFPAFQQHIQTGDQLFAIIFFWHETRPEFVKLEPLDMQLLQDWQAKQVTGFILFDGINFDYDYKNQHLITDQFTQLQTYVPLNVLTPANNLLYWPFFNPWLHQVITKLPFQKLRKSLVAFKISSNHQKVIYQSNSQVAWIGSRNFERSAWCNHDHMVRVEGTLANMIINEAMQAVKNANCPMPNVEAKWQNVCRFATPITTQQFIENASNIGKVIRTAEIKATILELISRSEQIDLFVNLLTDLTIIKALNQFVQNGGQLRIILDPNHYIFHFNMPYLPNIIPLLKFIPAVDVRMANTQYQMHTKAGLFTLKNGQQMYFGGSSNWTVGAIQRYAFNDLGILLVVDSDFIQSFQQNFLTMWKNALAREQILPHKSWFFKQSKYWLAMVMSWSGVNTW